MSEKTPRNAPRFGGSWTDEKLARIQKYLLAYMKIFSRNRPATYFQTVYVDAFAGAGFRRSSVSSEPDALFDVSADADAASLKKGSAQNALEITTPFSEYIFVEQDARKASSLGKLKSKFPTLEDRITIVQEDANAFLPTWCESTDWGKTRAVIFLDPFGMQVEWSTIVAMAETHGIDLWILFPLGVAVNRLLAKKRPPEGALAEKLTRLLGTSDWRSAFYRDSPQQQLFGTEPELVKDTDFDGIANFFVNRLASVFAGVAKNPLPLRNSKQVPIYLLCFAASNARGAATAVRIAQDILRR